MHGIQAVEHAFGIFKSVPPLKRGSALAAFAENAPYRIDVQYIYRYAQRPQLAGQLYYIPVGSKLLKAPGAARIRTYLQAKRKQRHQRRPAGKRRIIIKNGRKGRPVKKVIIHFTARCAETVLLIAFRAHVPFGGKSIVQENAITPGAHKK